MASTTAIILMTMVVAQTMCAPQVIIQNSSTIRTPANMSYEELDYILKVRNGEPHEKPAVLSPCARAILGCCRGKDMNPRCSEALNCGAFFFDSNPCDDKYVEEALRAAKSFYNQLQQASS